MREKGLQWAMELQSLAQAGLTYGKAPYDLERYRRIREISAEMVAEGSGLPLERARDLFCGETGYPTPKPDTRTAVFREGKILLVQDRARHNRPDYAYGVCKVFVLCRALGGCFRENIETICSDYFPEDALPSLSETKNTPEQVRMCFAAYRAGDAWKTQFD